MWNIKLKATNKHDKQRLMDMNCGLVATRGNTRRREVDRGKRGQIFGDRRKSKFGR